MQTVIRGYILRKAFRCIQRTDDFPEPVAPITLESVEQRWRMGGRWVCSRYHDIFLLVVGIGWIEWRRERNVSPVVFKKFRSPYHGRKCCVDKSCGRARFAVIIVRGNCRYAICELDGKWSWRLPQQAIFICYISVLMQCAALPIRSNSLNRF